MVRGDLNCLLTRSDQEIFQKMEYLRADAAVYAKVYNGLRAELPKTKESKFGQPSTN